MNSFPLLVLLNYQIVFFIFYFLVWFWIYFTYLFDYLVIFKYYVFLISLRQHLFCIHNYGSHLHLALYLSCFHVPLQSFLLYFMNTFYLCVFFILIHSFWGYLKFALEWFFSGVPPDLFLFFSFYVFRILFCSFLPSDLHDNMFESSVCCSQQFMLNPLQTSPHFVTLLLQKSGVRINHSFFLLSVILQFLSCPNAFSTLLKSLKHSFM